MRNLLIVLGTVILMGLFLFCNPTTTAYAEITGDFHYKLNDDDTVCILKYKGRDEKIVIPSELDGHSVTGIDNRAFYECSSLTSVIIPGSVVYVGEEAFAGCKIEEIILEEGITDITGWGRNVFGSYGKSITIPDSLSAFSLEPFIAFEDWHIYITPHFREIKISPDHPYYTLKGNSLLTADGKKLVCVINSDSITSYTVPKGVEIIGDYIFSHNEKLKSFTVPKGVTAVGKYVFYGCHYLTNLSLPDTLEAIGDFAFYNLYFLKNLKFRTV